MDHALLETQFLLICSLTLNGFWLGSKLIPWCRAGSGRLRATSLGLLLLVIALWHPYVYTFPTSTAHVYISALTNVSFAVLICCFNEWVRTAPRPWGHGEVDKRP